MSDQHIDNLLDALFAPKPEAKASERALQALESDLGGPVGPPRPVRAPRPAEPLLGATELDPMPASGPVVPDRRAPLSADRPDAARAEVSRPGLRPAPPVVVPGASQAANVAPRRPAGPATPASGLPLMPRLAPPAPPPGAPPQRHTGSMPRITGAMPRVTGSMQRFTDEALEPQGEMPPLGEAPRFAQGPPMPSASQGSTGPMPMSSRGVTGSMPNLMSTRVTGNLPSVDLGPRAITMPAADDDFLGGSEDPFASAEDLFHDVGELSFGEPEWPSSAAAGQAGTPFDIVADPTQIIGSLERVVRLKVGLNDVPWSGLDPRAGFVLTQVDGSTTYEELILISGMPEVEALALLARLVTLDVLG